MSTEIPAYVLLGCTEVELNTCIRGDGQSYDLRNIWHGQKSRLIQVPRFHVAALQRNLLGLLTPWEAHSASHAFVKARSRFTCLEPHSRFAITWRLDLEDFFHQFTFRRILGWMKSHGFAHKTAYPLALLATAREDGQAGGYPRRLPKGSCTSPHLSNLLFYPVDEALFRAASPWVYTRYADDLFFSGFKSDEEEVMRRVRKTLAASDFEVNPDKDCLLIRGRREAMGVIF